MKPRNIALFASSFRVTVSSTPGSLAVAALLILGNPSAHAQLTWNSAGPSNNWSTASGNENWNPGGVAWSQNQSAVFDATSGTPEAVNVTTANTFENITFDVSGFSISSAGAGSFILGNDFSSTISVTNAADSASIAETFANNSAVNSTLTKTGLGTLTLNGTAPNTYTGGTIISAGTLNAAHEGALGTGPVTNNGKLQISKSGAANLLYTGLSTAMTGTGLVEVTALGTGANTINLNGDYSGFTGNWTIGVGAAAGAGKVQMNGADNAATTINVLSNGTVFTNAGVHNAAIVLNGGDTGESFGQLRAELPGTVWAGPITLAGNISGSGDGNIGSNSGPVTISGNISESGGSRALVKSGTGTMLFTGNNTYTGSTRILGGNFSVSAINNAGASGPLGAGSTIGLGNGGNSGNLIYTGSGETTDRVIDLASTTGGGGVLHNGTGFLKFTSNFAATGVGSKNFTFSIPATGSGELAGQLGNNSTVGTTLCGAAFAASATSVTLASVDNVAVGASISGTGIAAGTIITAINTSTKAVTISPAASGAGTPGQVMTVTGVINGTNFTKDGLGTLTLSNTNSFTGGVNVNQGTLIINNSSALGTGTKTVILSNGTAGNPQLHLDGSAGSITLPASISYNTSNTSSAVSASIVNLAGNNTIAGNFTLIAGGGGTRILSNAGKITLSGTISCNTSNRSLELRGAADGEVSGVITNASNTFPVSKDGTGTWTLSGANTYNGTTTVNAGTLVISGTPTGNGNTITNGGVLKLDYTTNDSSKLGGGLILGGGTLELAGGTHVEEVTSTTLNPGSITTVTRSSGTAVLQMHTVIPGSGTVLFTANNIAVTDNNNVNGILPWARFGSMWGTNSTDTFDGPIVAYTGAITDVTRLGGLIPNDPVKNVRIINGGASGNVTLASAGDVISSLLMDAAAGPATIQPTASTNSLSIGNNLGGTLWQTANSGALTIGASANYGFLTSGVVDDITSATLTLLNDSTVNPITINSVIANNNANTVSVIKGGAGQVILNGNNTLTGTISTSGGALLINGSNTTRGSLTISNGGTAILSGDNSALAASTTGLTTISNGGTLQLQATPTNTTGGISGVLSAEQTSGQPLILNTGGLLQLRSDSTVTFTGGNNLGGLGSATVNFDVNQLTATGTGNTLTIAPTGFDVNTTTINVTGGNGYTLAVGKINGASANGVLTLNPTTANLSVNGYSASSNFTTTITLGGTSTGNTVTGNIVNSTAATTVTKNGTSTWTLSGPANTYTGAININDGKIIANSATALTTGTTLNMAGTAILDLNANNQTITNWGAGVTTATITDNSAIAGTTLLRGNVVTNTMANLVADGPTRKIGVQVSNANTNTPILSNTSNTFSGDFVLLNSAAGTRLTPAALPNGGVTGSPGTILKGPYGRGSIVLGQAATDKAGVIVSNTNTILVNPFVINTALGTDLPGIRVDSLGNVISGDIQANLANLVLCTNGTGAITLTGRITSAATATGLVTSDVNSSGTQVGTSLTVTLANTGAPNNYTGATNIGTKGILRLGAPNQIPNGPGFSDATISGQLQLAGFDETLNALNGAGNVTSISGTPVLTIGDNDATGTFSGSTSGSLGLKKVGGGIQILSGTIGHLGDTTVTGGTLWISAASTFANSSAIRLTTGSTLNLATAGTDVVNALYIDGVQQASGTWGKIGSGAAHESALITGSGLLSVTTAPSGSTFATWINGFFPGVTDPAIIGKNADPDGDGVNNITEFAFDGNPNSASQRAKVYVFTADSDGDTSKELVLTAAIRTGAAAFTTGAPSISASTPDAITYSIEGSTTLTSFPVTVNVLPTPITTNLPAVSSGYSYRSFNLQGSNGLPGKGFLRAGVITP